MKVAVISDVHGNKLALEVVITHMKQKGVDDIIFLGDLVTGGPDPQGAFDLMKYSAPLVWLQGNTDIWFKEDFTQWEPKTKKELYIYRNYNYVMANLSESARNYLGVLKEQQQVALGSYSVLCVHGSPRANNEAMLSFATEEALLEMLQDTEANIILAGHIHEPFIRKIGNKILINPGSVGLCNYLNDNRGSYVILTFITPSYEERELFSDMDTLEEISDNKESVDFNKVLFPDVVEPLDQTTIILNSTLTAEFCKVVYDCEAVLHQAIENQLPDIEHFEKSLLVNE